MSLPAIAVLIGGEVLVRVHTLVVDRVLVSWQLVMIVIYQLMLTYY